MYEIKISKLIIKQNSAANYMEIYLELSCSISIMI